MYQKVFPILFGLGVILSAASAQAQLCGDLCEVSLRPGNQSVFLKLEGWLFLDENAVTVTVLEEPIFGSWSDEKYSPSEAFWQAGGDRIRFGIKESATGVTTIHTIVLKVAEGANAYFETEDFEATLGQWSNLDPEWLILDAPGDITPSGEGLVGDYAMDIDFSTLDTAYAEIGRDSEEPKTGIDQMSGTVIVNATPPPNPTFSHTYGYSVLSLSTFATAEVRWQNDTYSIRTVIGTLTCSDCETAWLDLESGQSYRVSLSLGREAVGNPFAESAYGLDMVVEKVDGSWRSEETIDNLGPMGFVGGEPEFTIGAFAPTGAGEARVRLDDAAYGYGTLSSSQLVAVVEDFADGLTASSWTSTGPVGTFLIPGSLSSTGPDADWRGAVSFADLAPTPVDSSWADDGPTQSTTLWAHLKFDRSQLALGNWASFNLIEGQNAAGLKFMNLRVRTDNQSNVQFKLRIRDGSSTFQSTSWISMDPGESDIDFAWDGAAGVMQLWVGDTTERVDLLPGAYVVDEVSFGLINFNVGTSPPLLHSRYLVDDFALLYQ